MDAIQLTDVINTAAWLTLGAGLLVSTAAFIVMRLYVRSLLRESGRSMASAPQLPEESKQPHSSTVANALTVETEPVGMGRRQLPRSLNFRYADMAFRRAVYVYGLAGSVHALTSVAVLFLLGVYSLPPTASGVANFMWHAAVFWAWSAFTFVVIALLCGPDRRIHTMLATGYFATLVAMGVLLEVAAAPRLPLVEVTLLGHTNAFMVAIANVSLDLLRLPRTPEAITLSPHLQPTFFWGLSGTPILILIFAFNRFVRGTVGPLFITAALMITLCSFALIELALSTPSGLWLLAIVKRALGEMTFRALFTVSLVLATIAAWSGLVWIAGRYRRKQLSDQMFLFDALWLAASACVAVFLLNHATPFVFLLGLVPFALYTSIVAVGFAPLRRRVRGLSDVRLLFLRVFGSAGRTEKLFDLLSARWRYAGSIQLVTGTDVARGRFEPDEFLDFLNRRLASMFITTGRDLEQRLAALDVRPDPDGRFRVNEFFCHADTWQQTVTRLMAHSDLLVMDLRAFSAERKGCVFELMAILDSVPLPRAVFLVDDSTNLPSLEATLSDLWPRVNPLSPNAGGSARVRVIDLARGYPAAVRRLMELGDEVAVARPDSRKSG